MAQSALDDFARLQLAAALIEYDLEDGAEGQPAANAKVAEQSAIFAPYRTVNTFEHGNASSEQVQGYIEAYQNRYSALIHDEDDGDHGYNEEEADHQEYYLERRASIPTPSVFTDFLGGVNGPSAARLKLDEDEQGIMYDKENDVDLASEWGIDTVMSKEFDLSTLQKEAAAVQKQANKKKKARKSSFAQSDFLLRLPDVGHEDDEEALGESKSQPDLSRSFESSFNGLDSRSLPDMLTGPSRTKFGRTRKMKTSSAANLEEELETAFNSDGQETVGPLGSRSRSSSLAGALSAFEYDMSNFDFAHHAEDSSLAYAQEESARPPTSMSDYQSRFDPKAVAAWQAEEMASRPRFPGALHPKILVMPAPLADMFASEREAQERAAQEEAAKAEEKPRIEREAGKLFGRSLMDELQERKQRQKAKQRQFQGDNRRAMMDNPAVLAQRQVRATSPLAHAESAHTDDEKENVQPSANKAEDDRDPWAKYAARKSLAINGDAKRVTTLLSPGHSPNESLLNQQRMSLNPAGMSTKELQQAYKHSKYLSSLPVMPSKPASSDSEDDDLPLGERQIKLAQAQRSPIKPTDTSRQAEEKPKPSVFGQDLVMERELKKLDEILKVEEAEKKIEAERQRIKELELEAKEKKRREKMEQKERKRKAKQAAFAAAAAKEQQQARPADTQIESNQNLQAQADVRQSRHQSTYLELIPAFPPAQSPAAIEDEEELWHQQSRRNSQADFDEGMDPGTPGRPRSHSAAPSLDLNFNLSGNTPSKKKKTSSSMDDWFGGQGGDESGSERDSDEEHDTDRPVRVSSRLGLVNFGTEDGDSSEDDTAHIREKKSIGSLARMPELRTQSRADSFAGVLESFGIDSSDSEDEHDARRRLQNGQDSDDSEEEAPLAKVVARKSVAWPSTAARAPIAPPRLDLPMDFAISKGVGSAESDSEEDDTPLAIRKLQGNLAGKAAPGDESDEDDDVPLGLKQDDDRPLGAPQLSPTAAQQMQQQQQHMLLMAQMQMQYQYQMQLLAIQGQPMPYMAPAYGLLGQHMQPPLAPPSVAMSGQASDIGLPLPPDPKLVSSIDRWRQRLQDETA